MDEKELSKMTVTKLREIAKEYPSIQGVHAMKKDELITQLLEAIKEKGEFVEEKEVEGIEEFQKQKSTIKKQIKELKQQRDKAIKDKDQKLLKQTRSKIKKLRRTLRKLNLTHRKA